MEEPGQERKVFTLEEARALLPQVRELTSEAVARYTSLPGELEDERESVVQDWMRQVRSLGLEIKGLWLVDFDSGAGYYCWKYPEPAIDHFTATKKASGDGCPSSRGQVWYLAFGSWPLDSNTPDTPQA